MALPATELHVKTQADIDAENLLRTAHQRSIQAKPAEMAEFLQSLVGQQLTAYMTGCADAKAIGKWAQGERLPRGQTLQKLRDAYHVATLLILAEDEQTAQSWFVGMNPALNERAPAYVIREFDDGGEQAMQAARAFISYG